MSAPLTGKQLVAELARLGVGRWSGETVRGWIREEPACPIAEHADQGKPHRYDVGAVLTWLRNRALAERVKGFSSGDGPDLVARVDQALALLAAGPSVAEQSRIFAADAPAAAPAATTSAPAPTPVQRDLAPDWSAMTELEAALAVLKGRDPRNWKAVEEALNQRRKRLVEEGKLISVDELQLALDLQTEHVRSSIAAFALKLKSELRALVAPERHLELEPAIDQVISALLSKLASVDDLDQAPPVTA